MTICGTKCKKVGILLNLKSQNKWMIHLLGEYDCKFDEKGRVRLPKLLLEQFEVYRIKSLVINRGFEQHLVLYPQSVWDNIITEVNELNWYNEKNRHFLRYFYRGAQRLSWDKSDRVLINRSLLDYAKVDKEIVLFAFSNRVELWAKDQYNKLLDEEPKNFGHLAEEILGSSLSSPLKESL